MEFVASAFAQTADPVPQSVSPGAILQQQEKLLPYPQYKRELKKEDPAATEIEGIPQATPAPKVEDEVRLFVKKITVKHVHRLLREEVDALTAKYENRETSFADIQKLAQELTQRYQDKGYVTSSVYVPPQKIKNNEIVLEAVEGRVGNILVTPGRYAKSTFVVPRLALRNDDDFNLKKLKRSLRHINQNPDIQVAGTLKPGDQPGTTNVELTLKDRFPVHLSGAWNNTGRRLIGDNQVGATIQHNNLLGYGDRLSTSVTFNRRSHGVSGHYEMPIGSHGTLFNFDFGSSKLHLGEEFTRLDVRGSSSSFSPSIKQPIFNNGHFDISADVALDFKQLDTNIAGADFTRDQLRIIRPGINVQEYDRWGNTFVRQELGVGINALGGGNINLTGIPKAGGTGAFVRYTSTMSRTQLLPFGTYGIFRFNGQLTPDHLVSSEQFQSGGSFTVRGYREGILSGDKGFLLSAEWRVPFFLAPPKWKMPFTKKSLRQSIQLVSFVDYGAVYTRSSVSPRESNEQLLGAGVGVRASLTKFLTLRADLGVPLLRQGVNSQRPRLHFGFDFPLF